MVGLDAPLEAPEAAPPPRLVKVSRREWFGEGAARAAEIDYAFDPDEIVVSYTTTSPEEPEPDVADEPKRKRKA